MNFRPHSIRLRKLSVAAFGGLLMATLAAAAPTAVDTRPVAPLLRKSPLPAHWQHGVFMEIFVRA